MVSRWNKDGSGQAFFLTFSCYKRRRLLDEDHPKKVVLGVLFSQLAKQKGKCQGFVIMPDHVHAVVWFPEPDHLSHFMKQWKQRSSVKIKRGLRENRTSLLQKVNLADPVWQSGYYAFTIYSARKMKEKLDYMHANPIKADLVANPEEWPFSSAGYYSSGIAVGIPIEQPG